MASPEFTWQASLLDAAAEADVDELFSGLTRIELDRSSWVDYRPGWVSAPDQLFAQLVATADWGQRSRYMYDRRVQEPRLTSSWHASSGRPLGPAILVSMRRVLSTR